MILMKKKAAPKLPSGRLSRLPRPTRSLPVVCFRGSLSECGRRCSSGRSRCGRLSTRSTTSATPGASSNSSPPASPAALAAATTTSALSATASCRTCCSRVRRGSRSCRAIGSASEYQSAYACVNGSKTLARTRRAFHASPPDTAQASLTQVSHKSHTSLTQVSHTSQTACTVCSDASLTSTHARLFPCATTPSFSHVPPGVLFAERQVSHTTVPTCPRMSRPPCFPYLTGFRLCPAEDGAGGTELSSVTVSLSPPMVSRPCVAPCFPHVSHHVFSRSSRVILL